MDSIKQLVHAVAEIKKSKFLAFVHPLADEHEAKRLLVEYRKRYPDATHHAHAYTLASPATQNVSDDGEPHRSAGMPMLEVLNNHGLDDILAVVIRYYGGVKLGTGGLSRAYAGIVAAALQKAIVVSKTQRIRCTVVIPLEMAGRLEHHIRKHVATCSATYETEAVFTVDIDADAFPTFSSMISEVSGGVADLSVVKRFEIYR